MKAEIRYEHLSIKRLGGLGRGETETRYELLFQWASGVGRVSESSERFEEGGRVSRVSGVSRVSQVTK